MVVYILNAFNQLGSADKNLVIKQSDQTNTVERICVYINVSAT